VHCKVSKICAKPKAGGKPKADSHPEVAEPVATSEDKHNNRGQAQAGGREGVSA
jgi:hypothetical protein